MTNGEDETADGCDDVPVRDGYGGRVYLFAERGVVIDDVADGAGIELTGLMVWAGRRAWGTE